MTKRFTLRIRPSFGNPATLTIKSKKGSGVSRALIESIYGVSVPKGRYSVELRLRSNGRYLLQDAMALCSWPEDWDGHVNLRYSRRVL